jgi:curved DNA-binding protein CbpA
MPDKDYYKVLQVDPSAEPEVITAAFRKLSLKYHPDTNRAADAVARMQDINEAYDVLNDPARRAQYDRERRQRSSSDRAEMRRAAAESAEAAHRQAQEAGQQQARAEYARQQREQAEAAGLLKQQAQRRQSYLQIALFVAFSITSVAILTWVLIASAPAVIIPLVLFGLIYFVGVWLIFGKRAG